MVYRLALVTGATLGIGRAVCELFAQKGIDLIASGRNQQQLEVLKKSLDGQVSVQILPADLAQPQDRKQLLSIVHERVPNLVINSAGLGLYGEALTHTTEEQAAILEVNGRAVLELTLEAARTLISAGQKGVILNVSSAAAFHIFPWMAVYAASKAFVSQFSQAIDFEVKPYGIRILTLCPGMVATSFQERAGGKWDSRQRGVMQPAYVAEQIWKQIEKAAPLSIINWQYRFLMFLAFFIPESWIAAAEKRMISKRISPREIIKIKK